MDLQAQIQLLINNAPQDGVTPLLVESIAPGLRALAEKLSHSQYYILQNMHKEWVLTTLSKRTNPKQEKRVVYAFPTSKDVFIESEMASDPSMIAAPTPVIHILFQLIALEPVDSIVFFETPGTTQNAMEVKRLELQKLVQQTLEQKNSAVNHIPPDIA
ncbi:MAG: hypothetical protein AAFX80_08850 [Cyanobacteria bacterium J06639_18]